MSQAPERSLAPNIPIVETRSRNRDDVSFLELEDETMDETRHYRWVRADKNNNSVVRHKMKGYEVESRNNGVQTKATPDERGDSVIAMGDLILMSCPVEVYEKRQRKEFAKREQVLVSTSEEAEERARMKGITLIQDKDHNTSSEEK